MRMSELTCRVQDPDDLDFESLLRRVISCHSEGVMKFFQMQLQRDNITRNSFSPPGEVVFVSDGEAQSRLIDRVGV